MVYRTENHPAIWMCPLFRYSSRSYENSWVKSSPKFYLRTERDLYSESVQFCISEVVGKSKSWMALSYKMKVTTSEKPGCILTNRVTATFSRKNVLHRPLDRVWRVQSESYIYGSKYKCFLKKCHDILRQDIPVYLVWNDNKHRSLATTYRHKGSAFCCHLGTSCTLCLQLLHNPYRFYTL
jgi:hypothetical protein